MKTLKIVMPLLCITLFFTNMCIAQESVAHYQRGLGYLETGIVDKALNEFKKALPLFKEEKNEKMVADVYVALAHIYNWTGLYKTAITVCKQAIEINPNLAYAHYNLGFALREEGEIQLAKSEFALYNDLLKQQGEFVEVLDDKTLTTEKRDEEPDETVKSSGVKKSGKDVELSESDETVQDSLGSVHLSSGIDYYNDGMLDEAIKEFQEVLKGNPDNLEAHFNLGNVYVDKEMFEEAMSQYEKVIEIDPEHNEAILDLGMLYMDFDQIDEALILFKNASTANPDNAYFHFHLGEVYYRKQRYDKAVLEFNRALSINNMDPEIQFRLAETYNETKQFDLALEHMIRASELGYPVDQELIDSLKEKTR